MPDFHVLQCFACRTFQVHHEGKAKKWTCKMCGEKQSIIKVYGRGSGKDCRLHVQKLNQLRGEVRELQELSASFGMEQGGEMPVAAGPSCAGQPVDTQKSKWAGYVDVPGDPSLAEPDDGDCDSLYTTDGTQFDSGRPSGKRSHKLALGRSSFKRQKGNNFDETPYSNRDHSPTQPDVSEDSLYPGLSSAMLRTVRPQERLQTGAFCSAHSVGKQKENVASEAGCHKLVSKESMMSSAGEWEGTTVLPALERKVTTLRHIQKHEEEQSGPCRFNTGGQNYLQQGLKDGGQKDGDQGPWKLNTGGLKAAEQEPWKLNTGDLEPPKTGPWKLNNGDSPFSRDCLHYSASKASGSQLIENPRPQNFSVEKSSTGSNKVCRNSRTKIARSPVTSSKPKSKWDDFVDEASDDDSENDDDDGTCTGHVFNPSNPIEPVTRYGSEQVYFPEDGDREHCESNHKMLNPSTPILPSTQLSRVWNGSEGVKSPCSQALCDTEPACPQSGNRVTNCGHSIAISSSSSVKSDVNPPSPTGPGWSKPKGASGNKRVNSLFQVSDDVLDEDFAL